MLSCKCLRSQELALPRCRTTQNSDHPNSEIDRAIKPSSHNNIRLNVVVGVVAFGFHTDIASPLHCIVSRCVVLQGSLGPAEDGDRPGHLAIVGLHPHSRGISAGKIRPPNIQQRKLTATSKTRGIGCTCVLLNNDDPRSIRSWFHLCSKFHSGILLSNRFLFSQSQFWRHLFGHFFVLWGISPTKQNHPLALSLILFGSSEPCSARLPRSDGFQEVMPMLWKRMGEKKSNYLIIVKVRWPTCLSHKHLKNNMNIWSTLSFDLFRIEWKHVQRQTKKCVEFKCTTAHHKNC